MTLAQLAGIAGLAWILFRTAFGGSWKDNAKWIGLFVAVWGAMIVPKATVRVVDRLDPALSPPPWWRTSPSGWRCSHR